MTFTDNFFILLPKGAVVNRLNFSRKVILFAFPYPDLSDSLGPWLGASYLKDSQRGGAAYA